MESRIFSTMMEKKPGTTLCTISTQFGKVSQRTALNGIEEMTCVGMILNWLCLLSLHFARVL